MAGWPADNRDDGARTDDPASHFIFGGTFFD
jgi:hypothetical protein